MKEFENFIAYQELKEGQDRDASSTGNCELRPVSVEMWELAGNVEAGEEVLLISSQSLQGQNIMEPRVAEIAL